MSFMKYLRRVAGIFALRKKQSKLAGLSRQSSMSTPDEFFMEKRKEDVRTGTSPVAFLGKLGRGAMKFAGIFALRKKQSKLAGLSGGFTILEMLIVMPIIGLISGTMFSILFDQYGQMIIDTAQSNLRLEAQTMLLNLEDELLFTTEYGKEINSYLNDPYAPAGGWMYDSTPETLIVNETALNSDRRDPDRQFVRRKVGSSCDSYDPIAINNLIYFTEENAADEFKSLYKRTLIPNVTYCSRDDISGNHCQAETPTCKGNFKEQSCPEDNVNTGTCTRIDGLLSTKVKDFQITYFDENNVETTDPSQGEKIEMLLTLGERKYGKDLEITSRFIIKKIN